MAGIILLLSLIAATAAGAEQRSDAQIAHELRQQIRTTPHHTIFDSVQAEVQEGRVLLQGKVTAPGKREGLAALARTIPGVREVRNRLEVLPASPRDETLRVGIARALYGNSAFRAYASMSSPPIHIIVEHGRVTLEGVVQSGVERTLAGAIAGSFGAEVRNTLRTQASSVPE